MAATMPGRSAPSALSHRRPMAEQYVTVPTRCVRVLGADSSTFGAMTAPAPVRAGLFTDADPPHLLGGRCGACGQHHFPLHDVCPYCASEGTEAIELSATGRLWAWTAVTHPPPGYKGQVPYGFGVVELPEGLRVVTRLTEADPGRLHADQPMHMVIDPLHIDDEGRPVVVYAFAPDDAESVSSTPMTSIL